MDEILKALSKIAEAHNSGETDSGLGTGSTTSRSSSVASSRVSSENSSRRTSNRFDDDEEEELEVIRRRRLNQAQAAPAGSAREPSLSDFFLGAVGLAAVGLGAYFAGKALFVAGASASSSAPTPSSVIQKLKEFKEDLNKFPAVGLDCQWTQTFDGRRSPIALLQIATHTGKIMLVPLKKFSTVPTELLNLLGNRSIIKAGIEVIKDAKYLREDYGIEVKGTYDLRHLAVDIGNPPESLEKMSKRILDLDLGRDWELIESDWDASELDKNQIAYAETAVKASIDLFETMIKFRVSDLTKAKVLQYCSQKLDQPFIFYSNRNY